LHHHQNGQPSSLSRDAPSPFQLAEKEAVSDHIETNSDEKKLSIAALSQTFPERLLEQVTPLSAISLWNGSLVYWLPYRNGAVVPLAVTCARSPS